MGTTCCSVPSLSKDWLHDSNVFLYVVCWLIEFIWDIGCTWPRLPPATTLDSGWTTKIPNLSRVYVIFLFGRRDIFVRKHRSEKNVIYKAMKWIHLPLLGILNVGPSCEPVAVPTSVLCVVTCSLNPAHVQSCTAHTYITRHRQITYGSKGRVPWYQHRCYKNGIIELPTCKLKADKPPPFIFHFKLYRYASSLGPTTGWRKDASRADVVKVIALANSKLSRRWIGKAVVE